MEKQRKIPEMHANAAGSHPATGGCAGTTATPSGRPAFSMVRGRCPSDTLTASWMPRTHTMPRHASYAGRVRSSTLQTEPQQGRQRQRHHKRWRGPSEPGHLSRSLKRGPGKGRQMTRMMSTCPAAGAGRSAVWLDHVRSPGRRVVDHHGSITVCELKTSYFIRWHSPAEFGKNTL